MVEHGFSWSVGPARGRTRSSAHRDVATRRRQRYAAGQPTPIERRAIVRYDWESGALVRYAVPPGDQNSEPVFVLDARDLAAGPVATVHLPTRIPAGFHGAWLANEDRGVA
nr:carotenoid oxygenase family protein [Paraburkholderia kururiensis]